MRSRIVRPELFYNEFLGSVDPLATVLFIGLWTLADRDGRFEWREQKIKAKVFPYRDCDIRPILQLLIDGNFIAKYESGSDFFGVVLNFKKYQSINKHEAASILPMPPPNINASASINECVHTVREDLLEVILEVEGSNTKKGKVSPPPAYQQADARGNSRSPHPRFPQLWFSELELKTILSRFEKAGLQKDFQDIAFMKVEQWFTDSAKGRKEYPKSSNHMRRVIDWGIKSGLELQKTSDQAKLATGRLR